MIATLISFEKLKQNKNEDCLGIAIALLIDRSCDNKSMNERRIVWAN